METILVSACLLGDNTKYDGRNNYDKKIEIVKKNYDIIPICPEILGGLKTPRLKSEIKNGVVINEKGKNVTKYFTDGANKVINIVKYLHIKKAILMDRSPSCGVNKVYNGYFVSRLIDGKGITTQKLIENGVSCFTLDEFIEEFLKNEN